MAVGMMHEVMSLMISKDSFLRLMKKIGKSMAQEVKLVEKVLINVFDEEIEVNSKAAGKC